MTDKPTIQDCMEQAQTFASAWSLVGHGAFGTTMEQATAEKEALEAMLRDALAAPAQPAAPSLAGEPEGLPIALTSAPERIWLDLGFNPYEEDANFSSLSDLTWSQDNATGDGIEYVRADRAARGAAQAAPSNVPAGMWTIWESLPGYLIDHCEGQVISEEGLQAALCAMLADPKYSMLPTAQPAPVDAGEDASARFKAQHEFLAWNREQIPPPIESATEYSVFNQAVDFYIAARAVQEGK